MSKQEWSAWAQAIGTVLAVCVALAVPLVQLRARRKAADEVIDAAAKVVAAGQLLNMSQILGAATAIERAALDAGGAPLDIDNLRWLARTLGQVSFLDDAALHALALALPACAIDLVRGRGLLVQLQRHIDADLRHYDAEPIVSTDWPFVLELIVPALGALRHASESLDEYVP
ncbi:MAG: hypothetical protein IV093_04810 [Rubrivivax sp.]|nr:hypothetical protein [Rubrivivax sp.]